MADADADADKAEKIAAIREEDRPLDLVELERARNRAVRLMIRRFHEMKPQEVIAAVSVLDGEIATKRITKEAATTEEFSRDKALESLRGSAPPP